MTMDEAPIVISAVAFVTRSELLREAVVFAAVALPYILLPSIAAMLIKEKVPLLGFAEIGASTVLSRGVATEVIRVFWDRPRPFEILPFTPLLAHERGGAFPSGHVAFFAAIVFSSLIVLKKTSRRRGSLSFSGAVFLSIVLLNGIARVAAGVHWPSDILGGFVVAFGSALLVSRFFPHEAQ
jgi:undecaprenyl-diphosphatase